MTNKRYYDLICIVLIKHIVSYKKTFAGNFAMNIGKKIKALRKKNNLTQKELADRCELSKGFISLVESDQTSPSLSTLEDILTIFGISFHEFFSEEETENPVYCKEDVFVKKGEDGVTIHWLIPDTQKKDLEPIMVTLNPGTQTEPDDPHMGEEFGYVMTGAIDLVLGDKSYHARRGDSFSYTASKIHYLKNTGKTQAVVIWVSTPPSF